MGQDIAGEQLLRPGDRARCYLRRSAGRPTADRRRGLRRFTSRRPSVRLRAMFSHVVIFWINPADAQTADKLIAGAEKYLRPIPGIVTFHIGRMVGSHRPVVDQTYQVALNVIFDSKKAQDDYQVHPLHIDFVEKVLKPISKKVVVYDFE